MGQLLRGNSLLLTGSQLTCPRVRGVLPAQPMEQPHSTWALVSPWLRTFCDFLLYSAFSPQIPQPFTGPTLALLPQLHSKRSRGMLARLLCFWSLCLESSHHAILQEAFPAFLCTVDCPTNLAIHQLPLFTLFHFLLCPSSPPDNSDV